MACPILGLIVSHSSFTEHCHNAVDELRTLRDVLRWSVSQFNAHKLSFGHGSDNAWDEAVYLVLFSLHMPPDTLEPFLDCRLTKQERQRCIDIIARRCSERLPAAYLTGEAWLQGYKFTIDERCIVPRSPISELLMQQLSPWVEEPEDISSVLDLCTGSGCLAIIAANVFENALVDAVDLSPDALAVAQKNVHDYELEERLQLFEGDLYQALPPSRYQIIISNPPYVNEDSMQALPEEYLREPRLALAGGDDGMILVRRILEGAAEHLTDDGILVLEIGNEYANFVEAFPHLDPVWLSTENAEDQILLLTKEQLEA